METRHLDIWVADGDEAVRQFISNKRDGNTTISGFDVIVASSGVDSADAIRPGDIVMARRNNHETLICNGDLGLVTEHDGRLMVECGLDQFVDLDDTFAKPVVLSFHRVQGQTFRSILAIASGKEDDRHLRAALQRTPDVTLIGPADAVTKMVGPLEGNGFADPEDFARRTFLGDGVNLEVRVNGEAVVPPSIGPGGP